ncbi:glycosyl hydrolase family 28-related protein [Paenibacillus hodogayensis]|uniref:Glycosyl hydrolase family 28-related protein n=1 Tax=Paenibacillus hodogayensis TaxID=279208 RepID=A0ABV5W8G5_9BACL
MGVNKPSSSRETEKPPLAGKDGGLHDLERPESGERMSRRKLLTTLGVTSAAVASGVLLNAMNGEASVTNSVYGGPEASDADQIMFRYASTLPERTVADKLRERISVRDFGAVGDGLANDAPSIQSAIDTAIFAGKKEVWFPPGTYKLDAALSNSTSVVFVGDNVQFSGGMYRTVSLSAHEEQLAIRFRHHINVLSKGADPTGGADATAAFESAVTELLSKTTSRPDIFGVNNEGNAVIELPPGTFVLNADDPRLFSATAIRTRGLVIKGAGRGVTKVLFKPANNDGYLFYNNDKWLHIHMEGITFIGDFTKNTNFMFSFSTGGAQNYTFSMCDFIDFNYGWKLQGNNTNSEYSFYHCGFYGSWNKVVFAEASNASDQFLNYNFFACQFEVTRGDFLHFEKGGNINIWGGSYIHTSAAGGTFFKLYGGAHSYGVQRFLCIGARFETKYGAGKLIDCKWNDGNVSFISCDADAQAFQSGAESWMVAKFTSTNEKMPVISFDKCNLMGIHEYAYTGNSFKFPHNVSYTNCQFAKKASPSDFILYTPTGTSNTGGQPPITFHHCRGNGDTRAVIWNMVYGYNKASTAVLGRHIVSIKGPDGKFPANSGFVDIELPLHAIVTKVTLYAPTGAVTESDSATFTVQTTETVPTVLAQAAPAAHRDGFQVSEEVMFVCDSDKKRKLQLVAGADVSNFNPLALCLIEYIG